MEPISRRERGKKKHIRSLVARSLLNVSLSGAVKVPPNVVIVVEHMLDTQEAIAYES